ncbi:MAG: hypothetical protein LBF51_07640, partial [Zoogloeaceae bacterium]|nr:hypothetical protein [Zoogloeaceae bacterium]
VEEVGEGLVLALHVVGPNDGDNTGGEDIPQVLGLGNHFHDGQLEIFPLLAQKRQAYRLPVGGEARDQKTEDGGQKTEKFAASPVWRTAHPVKSEGDATRRQSIGLPSQDCFAALAFDGIEPPLKACGFPHG